MRNSLTGLLDHVGVVPVALAGLLELKFIIKNILI